MQDGALDDALKTEGWLRIDFFAGENGRVLGNEVGQQLSQVVDIRRTCAQHLGGRGIVEQSEQQMLHGNELVALLARFHERHVEAYFQFLSNHLGLIFNFLPLHTVTDVGAV